MLYSFLKINFIVAIEIKIWQCQKFMINIHFSPFLTDQI